MSFENFKLDERPKTAPDQKPKTPKRGEQLRTFWQLAKKGNFEQYPRLKAAYLELCEALTNLGLEENEQRSIFDSLASEDKLESSSSSETLTETANFVRKAIISSIGEKIGVLHGRDLIRLVPLDIFTPLDIAMKKFYLRSLEVLASFKKQEREHLASHRAASSKTESGFAFNGPELSLEAIATALKQGVRTIEIDVVALKDGTPVVSHGLSTKTNEGKKKFADIDNIASAQSAEATIDKTGAPVYALEILLQRFVPYKGLARLNIEIKDPAVIPKLVELIKRHGLEQDVIISSFNPKALLNIHEALPATKIGVDTLVDELNADTILDDKPKPGKPLVLPFKIGIGGSELPNDPNLSKTHFSTLPAELRKLLSDTKGFLTVQLKSAVYGLFNENTLKDMAAKARSLGFELLMFRVPSKRAAFLRDEVGLLHLDEGEKVTYGRLGRSE